MNDVLGALFALFVIWFILRFIGGGAYTQETNIGSGGSGAMSPRDSHTTQQMVSAEAHVGRHGQGHVP